jgi:hypothetical protein
MYTLHTIFSGQKFTSQQISPFNLRLNMSQTFSRSDKPAVPFYQSDEFEDVRYG